MERLKITKSSVTLGDEGFPGKISSSQHILDVLNAGSTLGNDARVGSSGIVGRNRRVRSDTEATFPVALGRLEVSVLVASEVGVNVVAQVDQ